MLGLGLYFSSHSSPSVPNNNDHIDSSTSMIVASTSSSHIENKESRFIADIETPSLSGHEHAAAFNTLIKIYVDRATEEFIQNTTEANFNIPESFKNERHQYFAKADTKVIADRYVVVEFTREYSMIAAAHPFHMIETVNYDLEAENVIELSEIFIDVDKALSYISSRATEQVIANLKAFDGEESFIKEGAAAKEANFRDYIIDEKGLTFYFEEYQVAPYAAGPQQATLTWTELRPLLTPQFKLLAQ